MKADPRIAGLARITGLMLDQQLAILQKRKRAQAETQSHLVALSQQEDATDVALAVAAQVGLRYAAWADRRKAALNIILAQQTVAVLAAEDTARVAFARNSVMEKLAKG